MVHTPERRASQAGVVDGIIGLGLALGALGLYRATLAPTLLGGDAGEFQFVPPLLGVAHPTGYPLYVLLGWVWTHLLPMGDVAFRMNLFSAVAAAAAVGFFYLAALTFLRLAVAPRGATFSLPEPPLLIHRSVAALAAATLAVTPTLWSQAVMAEVYGLHILLGVLFCYLLLGWGQRQDPRALRLAALILGLGLAHHRTTVLLAPAAIVYVWLVDRTVWRDRRLLAQAALLALLPQLLYLLIPLRAPYTPYLHLALAPGRELVLYENSLTSFIDFVLGGPFGGSLDLSVNLVERVAMAATLLRAEVGWAGIVLAATGVAWLALTRRTALLALTGVAYLGMVAFNLVYTIGDIMVLFIPSYALFALWIALGAGVWGTLVARAAGRLARRPVSMERVALLAVLPLCLLPLWLAAANYGDIDRSQATSVGNGWRRLLARPLPDGAVLVSDDRNEIMALWYLQYVEGVRPDLLGLFPLITQEEPALGHVLDLALSTERPVYLIKEMPGIEVKVDVVSEAGLWRVVGPAATGPPEYEVGAILDTGIALVGYGRAPRSPHPGEMVQVSLVWEALAEIESPYQSYVHLVDASGQALAQSDHRPGEIFYPTTQWRPGERLRDDHALDVPQDTAPGVYRLVAGMYQLAEDGAIVAASDPITLGPVAVKSGAGPGAAEPGAAEPACPAEVVFGGEIELRGYEVVAGGDGLEITLQWRALRPPVSDDTVFVHLVDPGGEIVAQGDAPPQGGVYPTSVWDAGEVVLDVHWLRLPAGTSATDLDGYQLRVGLYDPRSGERLPASTGGDSISFPLPPLP
ncbi:MAG: DUF2723 domain-containing protein [Anaerolineae bacterium]|nr:DUF2723 domain-containing protein [Anaerolineae bacterium]